MERSAIRGRYRLWHDSRITLRSIRATGLAFNGPLTVEASVVGDAILRAVENKTDVVYVSGKWRLVMLIIKTLPEAVFKKLKF